MMKPRFFTISFLLVAFLFAFSSMTFSQDVPSAGPVPMGTQLEKVPPPFTNPNIQFRGTQTAFAFQTFPTPTQYVTFPIPGYTPTVIGPGTFVDFASDGCFAPNGTFFLTTAGDVSGTAQLYTINTATGAATLRGNITGVANVNGITYDPSNGNFYICNSANLYTIDTATGAPTLVGPFNNTGGLMIDISVDCNGIMYAVDLGLDNTYTVNKATGAITLLGPLGFNMNFGGGMTYDREEDILYLLALDGTSTTNALRTINTTTGAATTLHTWTPALSQFAPFDIVGNGSACGGSGGSTPNASLLLPTPGVNTNYVAIPHQPSMVGFGNNVTIEAWVNVGSFSTANTVLNKGGASFDYQLGIGSTGIPFFRAQGVIATGTGVVVTAGTWTHLAVTYDGTTARFYKDGVLGATVPLAMTFGSSSNEMRIGRGNADPGSGNIDEVRLWSVARSGADILADMCKKWPGTFTNSTGLKAVWHLDSTLTDSVSGYNGTQMGTGGFGLPATCLITSVNQIGSQIPERFTLSQNYPNPFNPTTTIRFEIPTQGLVSLKVFDIAGREVGDLINEVKPAGIYLVGFNGNNLASGTYFYRLQVGDFVQVRKMVLLK